MEKWNRSFVLSRSFGWKEKNNELGYYHFSGTKELNIDVFSKYIGIIGYAFCGERGATKCQQINSERGFELDLIKLIVNEK